MGPNYSARLIVGRQLSPRGLSPSRSFATANTSRLWPISAHGASLTVAWAPCGMTVTT